MQSTTASSYAFSDTGYSTESSHAFSSDTGCPTESSYEPQHATENSVDDSNGTPPTVV